MSANPIATVELPAKLTAWNETHIDEALRRIGDSERVIAQAALDRDGAIARAKSAFEKIEKTEKAMIAALKKRIRAAAERLRGGWTKKSANFQWGAVSFHFQPKHLVPIDAEHTEEQAIVRLEGLGHADAVQIIKRVRLEILEAKPAEVITAAGYRWADPRETCEVKTSLTIAAEQAAARPEKERS
ncbi:host-nuclease inhibitor Gam family protein [Zavarzinia sp.]|uniref:host-nuclease inhibitor Gam family protein n=1 Tax=Zavarzinia sp. TaxID=2027920 RepID=UPI003564E1ED